ncbi:uncharacterized protein DNG_04074 [Cephalotrichum gorgonifer]|uniref:Uncharacterized protein n=1 Tax=Cephalotrichum gorgonifer TaxID=2041049 RepID=A0AAE8MVV8_9PEZI|nr:uncharacterized protein DNG_04074 [Cephalotrichum gorgonifer]
MSTPVSQLVYDQSQEEGSPDRGAESPPVSPQAQKKRGKGPENSDDGSPRKRAKPAAEDDPASEKTIRKLEAQLRRKNAKCNAEKEAAKQEREKREELERELEELLEEVEKKQDEIGELKEIIQELRAAAGQ